MKFYGTPNMLIRVRNVKPFRAIRFDANGEYETDHPRLIARLKTRFKPIETTIEEPIEEFKCKKCDFVTENKGLLLAHYRTHKKEG